MHEGFKCRFSHDSAACKSIRAMQTKGKGKFPMAAVPPKHRVLVDSGANEIIRPYHHQWWIDINKGKRPGKKVGLSLAGNSVRVAIMNEFGELMMEEEKPTPSDIGWILPVSRLQGELGMGVMWNPDGTADLLHPDGQRTSLILDDGLTFMPWEDFQPIRMALGNSHKKEP